MRAKNVFIWILASLSTLVMSSCNIGTNKEKLSPSERESLSQALAKYDQFSNFWEGLSKVSKDDKCGFIDKTGKEVIPCIYLHILDDYEPLYEGFAVMKSDNMSHSMGFFDKTGKEIIPCTYYSVQKAEDYGIVDLILIFVSKIVEQSGRESQFLGAFDKTGIEVIPCIYSRSDLDQKIKEVRAEGKYSRDKIKYNYPEKDYSHNGYATLGKNGKYDFDKEPRESGSSSWGFNDFSKDIEKVYFSEGLAKVKWNNQEGFVDTEGYFIGKGIVKKMISSEEYNPIPQEEEIEEEYNISPKIEEIYKYIKGKSFKGTTFSTQHNLSIIKDYLILTFNPTNEFEGNVSIKAIREVNSASDNLSGTGGIQSGVYSYYITEDGIIVIGQIILEKKKTGFQSNLRGVFRGPTGDDEYDVSFN